MAALTADKTSQLLHQDPNAQFLLVNNDEVNPVYISQARTVAATDTKIAPQGSVGLAGWWYVSTLDPAVTAECFVLPGGFVWSNPVGVQISLNTLGLALDTTVADLPPRLQSMGIPPFIPNVISQAIEQVGPGGSPYTVTTAMADTFLWYGLLSFAGSSNASHVGNDQAFCTLRLASGRVLIPLELAFGDAASATAAVGQTPIGGQVFNAGDSVVLDVNNGNLINEVEFRASCVVWIGTP